MYKTCTVIVYDIFNGNTKEYRDVLYNIPGLTPLYHLIFMISTWLFGLFQEHRLIMDVIILGRHF